MIITEGTRIYGENNRKYEALEQIGAGGFGSVWKIRDIETGEHYALKTLKVDYSSREDIVSITNDATKATKIQHENVIKYHFFHDGSELSNLPPYIIMDYTSEGSLTDLLRIQKSKKESFGRKELISIFAQLIGGMSAVNETLVHRDVKPDNILVFNNKLKIADFGLSKIIEESTRSFTFKGGGTSLYMAPEVWSNAKSDIQMDIYSMGIVFYQCATLMYPYAIQDYSDVEEVRKAHLFQSPRLPSSINAALTPVHDDLILTMMAKPRQERFNSWDDVESCLARDKVKIDEFGDAVDNIVAKEISRKNEQARHQLEQAKREQAKEDYRNIIKYQFEKDIVVPLKGLSSGIKARHGKDIIKVESSCTTDICSCSLRLQDRRQFSINLDILHDDEYSTLVHTKDVLGQVHSQTVFQRPVIENKSIMAWGGVISPANNGFNILLLENEGEDYGQFLFMAHTVSGLVQSRSRPEPIVLDTDELKEAVRHYNVTSRFQSRLVTFDIAKIINFIQDSI